MPEPVSPAGILDACRRRGWRLATAESCTGGLLAAALTDIPGSSDAFSCGWVTYANDAKIRELGIAEAMLARYGAVSPEIAAAMAEGALRKAAADLAIGITGIAGPGGATPGKPVGLVYIGLAHRGARTQTSENRFSGGRADIRFAARDKALALLGAALAE